MASLQGLCIQVALRTQMETSMIHGAWTEICEAVAFLRKLADAIAIELRREPSRTRTPSRDPATTRTRPCL